MDEANTGFISEWKPIRNQLSIYWSEQIFVETIKELYNGWGKSLLDLAKDKIANPWHCLLMLKWGLVYGTLHKRDAKKPFGRSEWEYLFSKITNLPAHFHLLDSKSDLGLWKFMRANFTEQFFFQQETGFYGLAVLETILLDIKIAYPTNEKLKEFTGVELEDFIDLQLLVGGGISHLPRPQRFDSGYFKRFKKSSSDTLINRFLDGCSLDYPNLIQFMKEDHKRIRNPEFEFSLFSSLHRKPFFKHDGKYQPYHPTLIKYFIEFGIYDILKLNDAKNFSQHFGTGFESYVGIPLRTLGHKVFDESELKKELREDSVPDYGLVVANDFLFVEAKSAEMHALTLQDPQEMYLRRTLENSVIKGYKQIFNAAQKVRLGTTRNITCSGQIYGIIVTFKQLFLGQPNSIWIEFMEKIIIESFTKEVLANKPVLPENIFCLSVFEFDSLCAYSLQKKISIVDCLKTAAENNRTPEKASFMFNSHFKDSEVSIKSIPHVITRFNKIMERLRSVYDEQG